MNPTATEATRGAPERWRFDRHELAGSLGDLGTLLPIAIALILVNGMDPVAVFGGVGAYYVIAGLYFRTVVPVQPMKVIGAYAVARALTPLQVSMAGLWVGLILLLLAGTKVLSAAGRLVPRPTIRGVQLAVGVLLVAEGIRFLLGQASMQRVHGAAEPFLSISRLGPIPIGLLLGATSVVLILLLSRNRFAPASLVVLGLGAAAGAVFGAWRGLADMHLDIHLPALLPYGSPGLADAGVVLLALTLPQMPMTVGNALVAQADLTKQYFGEEVAARVTLRALAVSMGLANLAGFLLGSMPMCHGAGGLAAHYRFGARTAGSNLMIGLPLLLLGLVVGDRVTDLFGLIPLAVLGALLIFAGAELALMILDVKERRDLFVVLVMLATALATNLGVAFVAGLILAHAVRYRRIAV